MNRKGFTLVELLIVIAVIGILAGVFFIGVTGFRNSALDARRIADMKNVQSALELYYSKCRIYPNSASLTANCPAANTGGNETLLWDNPGGSGLIQALTSAGIGVTAVPKEPSSNPAYQYVVELGGQRYVLAATLSGDRDVLRDAGAIQGGSAEALGLGCYSSGRPTTLYCVGPR